MYIGLISDTHGIFSEQFKEFFAPVDVIWHAGDFGAGAEFVKSIAEFKPLVGVYGNCDGSDIRRLYPSYQVLQIQGLKILMTHIKSQALIDLHKPDIFICGHSHILKVAHEGDMMYINPGAAGLQGWQVLRTALRFKIEDGQVKDMEVFKLKR